MPTQITVLRVVVASPTDVKPERDCLWEVVREVNHDTARSLGFHLDLVQWETDSQPGFHVTGPQGVVDPSLRIQDSDILIGIFWRRFGTPIPSGQTGTEHEFSLAYDNWKEVGRPAIMMYFNQKPYFPSTPNDLEQHLRVMQFKKDFPKEGLWWDYSGKEAFKKSVAGHLRAFLQKQTVSGTRNTQGQAGDEVENFSWSTITSILNSMHRRIRVDFQPDIVLTMSGPGSVAACYCMSG